MNKTASKNSLPKTNPLGSPDNGHNNLYCCEYSNLINSSYCKEHREMTNLYTAPLPICYLLSN